MGGEIGAKGLMQHKPSVHVRAKKKNKKASQNQKTEWGAKGGGGFSGEKKRPGES